MLSQKEIAAQREYVPVLHDLHLGTYVANALARAGILTVDQLAWRSEQDLKNVRGVGAKGIAEVKIALARIGRSLREEPLQSVSEYAARRAKLDKNKTILKAIRFRNDRDAIEERVGEAIQSELDLDVKTFLAAYQQQDVELMVLALTGWEFRDLLAKAKVIPDTDRAFYQEDVPAEEIVFPEGVMSLEEQIDLYLEDRANGSH